MHVRPIGYYAVYFLYERFLIHKASGLAIGMETQRIGALTSNHLSVQYACRLVAKFDILTFTHLIQLFTHLIQLFRPLI